ncbi:hypothetical protein llap_14785 [Limosa lapponica baueri]|uniref:Rna-directed dna polymerase from mobile element jockey-like n=1 Tax=Limosa lapponica baueri TaxID=1758121 RepID=A0A2I0TMF9_LIMLA|nr:hypothetical protein llap_14785 [Limosa lapponica baueri]
MPYPRGIGKAPHPLKMKKGTAGRNWMVSDKEKNALLYQKLLIEKEKITPKSKSYGDEPVAPEVVEVNRETPARHLKVWSPKKVAQPTAQMKCLYTNARSMGNKQEELEATMLLESYDIVAINETWLDESYDWTSGVEGYKLLKRAEVLPSMLRNR